MPQEEKLKNEDLPKEENSEETAPQEEATEKDPLDLLQNELNESKDKFLRLYSDFDNYKKRNARERMDLIKQAGVEVILSMLPVLDDFERAFKAHDDETSTGYKLIFNKFKSTLEQKGLKEMKSKGETFDTDLHDAITSIPAPTPELKGKVIDELEKGYYLNDKVIRHAKVVIGQ